MPTFVSRSVSFLQVLVARYFRFMATLCLAFCFRICVVPPRFALACSLRLFAVSFACCLLQVLAGIVFLLSVPQSSHGFGCCKYLWRLQFQQQSLAAKQLRPNKALHPTTYSSVRFGRKLPSLSALPAAGELSRCAARVCVSARVSFSPARGFLVAVLSSRALKIFCRVRRSPPFRFSYRCVSVAIGFAGRFRFVARRAAFLSGLFVAVVSSLVAGVLCRSVGSPVAVTSSFVAGVLCRGRLRFWRACFGEKLSRAKQPNTRHNKALHPTAYSFVRRSSSLCFRRRVSLSFVRCARLSCICYI